MKIKNIYITIKKELRSIFRDKKTLIRLLIFPLLIPCMIFLYCYLYNQDSKTYDIGINYNLNEVEKTILTNLNLKTKKYDDLKSMEEAYKKEEIAGYIEFDTKENKYVIYTNEDSSDGMYVSNYAVTYLENYKESLAQQYLIEHNVNVEEAYSQVNYESVDLEGENFFLLLIFSVSFTYIIMAIVISSTNMAISATAVEKENGTLETILTFPIKSSELITGKYLATVILGFISAIIGLLLTIISLLIATKYFAVFANVIFNLSTNSIILSLLVVFAASLFISGMAIALTSFSKTYKEAQSSSQILTFLTMIPMFISLLNVDISKFFYLIPIANYTQILMDIFSGNLDMFNILIMLLCSIIYVIIVIYLIIKEYKSEKVLFE